MQIQNKKNNLTFLIGFLVGFIHIQYPFFYIFYLKRKKKIYILFIEIIPKYLKNKNNKFIYLIFSNFFLFKNLSWKSEQT